MKEIIVPASPGFYALFLSDKGLKIPQQFFRHPVAAWEIHQGEPTAHAWPICVTMDGNKYDFIQSPDGVFEHVTGFTSNKAEEALAFALDQEAMAFGVRAA